MFGYYLNLALRSFKRNRAVTILMIVIIGFGVAASMTTWSVFRAASGDPIPSKSAKLYVPQIDNWGPAHRNPSGDPPDMMDYTDAINLLEAHRARYQVAMYRIAPTVVPDVPGKYAFVTQAHAVSSGFFPMLEVPFTYGGPWTREDASKRARVAVINSNVNQELFGGADSVGKILHIKDKSYRIVGVMDHFNPQPRFYDLLHSGGYFEAHAEGFFIPLRTAIADNIRNTGDADCYSEPEGSSFVAWRNSECGWLSFMVELDTPAQVAAYRMFLDGYARQQRKLGRFAWPPNNRLRDLHQWMAYLQVVPDSTRIALFVALGLLIVCLVNTAGLLLAKFLRRSGEIGARRALGASRSQIYVQFLIEAAMVGLAGGVLGLILTGLGVHGIGWVMPPDIAVLVHVNASLLGLTLLLAIASTIVAGFYPTFRAARVAPALQLKSN